MWQKTIKTYPKEIDDWTHYLHDAAGNAVAKNSLVGYPKHIHWVAGPLWSRSHEFNPSLNALVSGGGRMTCILDEGNAEAKPGNDVKEEIEDNVCISEDSLLMMHRLPVKPTLSAMICSPKLPPSMIMMPVNGLTMLLN